MSSVDQWQSSRLVSNHHNLRVFESRQVPVLLIYAYINKTGITYSPSRTRSRRHKENVQVRILCKVVLGHRRKIFLSLYTFALYSYPKFGDVFCILFLCWLCVGGYIILHCILYLTIHEDVTLPLPYFDASTHKQH